jgi:hypothetical protein
MFWALAFLLTLQGRYEYVASAIAAAMLHEGGHALIAYYRGYKLNQVTLTPFGAVLYGAEKIQKKTLFK